MAVQGPFEWQGRLESEGEVVFGSRWSAAFTGSGQLSVTHDGVRLGTRPLVPFDRLTAVATSGQRLTVFHLPGPDDRLGRFERRSGQKRMLVKLSRWGPVRASDLAVWLLKLKGGPLADVETTLGGAGIARVYRLRE